MIKLPPEFDPEFYGSTYADLSTLSVAQLKNHYQKHGCSEGRIPSKLAVSADFCEYFSLYSSVLEIGPFDSPRLKGDNVAYFDVLDREHLMARAEKKAGRNPANIPFIHWVSHNGDLSVIEKKFELVFSSHSIEHQPDLIKHLNDVAQLLEDGGHYALICPDYRYCFDHSIGASSAAEIIDAHFNQRKFHTLASVVEHHAMTVHNDVRRHWAGDHGKLTYSKERTLKAIRTWKNNKDKYVDVHAWQFCPETFREIMAFLRELELINLKPVRVYETVRDSNGFNAVLEKC